MIRCWRLDDGRQTLVLGACEDRLAEVVYWGPRLSRAEDLTTLYDAAAIDLTGGMLDANPELSVCPEASRTFPGHPGLILNAPDGTHLLPAFGLEKVEQSPHGLVLHYVDGANALRLSTSFEINPHTHVITAQTRLVSDGPVHLHWLAAPVFPAPQLADEMIDFAGRWCGEFGMMRHAWAAGVRCRENRTGRSGHEHFPGLILPVRGATNVGGHCFGFHYGWSGGHRMIAEELPDGRRQIQFGHMAGMERAAGTAFQSAPLYAVFSDDGLNGCAVAFQRHLRDEIVCWPRPERPRPVHYNCWEAVYFDHDLPVLQEIAQRAADLGAERFVLDDGWFGQRNNDTAALGDWEVDPRKYPDGLTPLIQHVRDLGMSFGLWFEPEMVNPDSDVFRAHPDWCLGHPQQIPGRQQLVLNMALPEVRAYLFHRISRVLRDNAIEYVKWDHNRVLPVSDADQIRGTYDLIDELRAAFPEVEIESCASGGGRIDFGILSRTHRVWLSDSNDALERLRIQHNSALFLPWAVTGSHVGPRACHTSGRVLDIRFRAWVAAQRHMGFEMDPRELTPQEAQILRDVTAWWKANRDWMFKADILRLESSDPAIIAEQQLACGGERFVVFAGRGGASGQIAPRPLPLTRLEPNAIYRVELANRGDASHLSRGNLALKTGPLHLSGQYLMSRGLTLPWSFPESMWVIEGAKL